MNYTLTTDLGSYEILFVNEDEVRSLREDLEEFTNYAIHSDFPDFINPYEIWISKNVQDSELCFLLLEATLRYFEESQGMSPDGAYRSALQHVENLRHTCNQTSFLKVHMCDVLGMHVYLVDGFYVRNKFKSDFVEGTNPMVDSFVPSDEIWIDSEVPEQERRFILLHEVFEYFLMKRGMSYDLAHDKASHMEWLSRKNHDLNKS